MTQPKPKRRFRWRTIGCLLFVLLAIGGTVALTFFRNQIVRPPDIAGELVPMVVPVEQGNLIETVQVNGALEPADQTKVSFPEGVRVAEVLIAEGERVTVGQVLARLETRDLELKVASSTARLDQAQQALDKLLAGPTRADLAQAAARIARARADLAADGASVRQVDIDLAKNKLDLARERLEELQGGQLPPEAVAAEKALAAAQDALVASKAALERTRDSASQAKTAAEQAVERGVQDLERAQRAYSDAFWDWDYVQRTGRHPREQIPDPESGKLINRELTKEEIEQFRRTFEDAGVALKNSEQSLKNLVEAAEQSREDEVRQIQAAERDITSAERTLAEAQREYDRQRTRGAATALLEARAAVADAEKAYRELVDNPARPARRAELEAALLEAIAAEEKLKAGPDKVDLAQARTAVEEARAAVATAEADLDAATLRAPIAGTVVDITIKQGVRTTTTDSVTIADLSRFLLRGQVTEQSVAAVQVGQAVQVAIDSVPGQPFSGTLTRVSELPADTGQSGGGGFNPGIPGGGAPLGGLYPVEIVIVAEDQRLRVGMAATGNIETLAIRGTLIVPLQAVISGPDGAYVQRVVGEPGPDGAPPTEDVPVEIGASSGDLVQVLSGLSAGDSVLLPQVPPMEVPTGPVF